MSKPPIIRNGIFDKNNWWYVCPYCNEPIDHNEKKCRWCGKEINWDKKDGEQE